MQRKLVYLAALALAILHQDFWLWDNATLWFGFMPVGLAYHALYSCLAAALAYWAIRVAWPEDLASIETAEDESEPTP